MSGHRSITEEMRDRVRQRAKGLCEYCHAIEQWQYVRFTVDHVIPLSRDGSNQFDNLALACFHCNRKKHNNIIGIDELSNREVELFNPRSHLWSEHLIWSSDRLKIMGLTATGRATVIMLDFNRSRILNIRAADLEIGRHPPPDDPIQE